MDDAQPFTLNSNECPLSHSEFVKLHAEGAVSAGIDKSLALRLIDHPPRRYQAAHTIWSWIWMLSIPGSLLLSVFWKWWAGPLALFVVPPMIFKATKESAAQFVLEHATDDEEFFDFLCKANVLQFRFNTIR